MYLIHHKIAKLRNLIKTNTGFIILQLVAFMAATFAIAHLLYALWFLDRLSRYIFHSDINLTALAGDNLQDILHANNKNGEGMTLVT